MAFKEGYRMRSEPISILLSGIMIIIWLMLILSAIAAIIMLINLNSKGDERKRAILLHSGSRSFQILAISISIHFVSQLIRVIFLKETIMGINPIVAISLTSLLYTINLFYFKKKMGG